MTVKTPATETKSVSLNKSALTLSVGETDTLTAMVKPDSLTDKSVTWSTSNAAAATVTDGRVEAIAPGTATITAALTTDNDIKATCTVTVKPALSVNMPLPPDKSTIKQGESQAYEYTVNPTDSELTFLFEKVGSEVAAGKELPTAVVENGKIKVSVSENVDVADYDFTVTATKSQQAKSTTHTIKVAAKDAPPTGGGVQSVVIEGGNHELLAEATLDLTATVTPDAAGKTVMWKARPEGVVEISGNGTTGTVTAKSANTANITATVDGVESNTVQIKVIPRVEITAPAKTEVPKNEEILFTFDVKGFGDRWTEDRDIEITAELKDEEGNTEVTLEWGAGDDTNSGLTWDPDDVRTVGALSDKAGEYSLHITVKKTIDNVLYTGTSKADFTVTASPTGGGSDEPDEPDSAAPASQSTAVQQQPTPPRTFSFIPQREIQSKPAAPAVTVEPEQKQEPEKEPEKVQEPVKEPAKEPEKVQEPEKEPEKVQEPEPEQKPEQKQGIALTCADSFKAGETLTLFGTVNGVSSAMRKIDWSIRDAGATGAAIRDGVMSAEQAGTVTIAATVQNSTTTEYFTITVLPGEPKNDAPETQEPEQTPTEPQEPAEGGQPNAPAEPVTPVVPVEPDGQTPVVTPPAVQVGTVTLPNGQVITNAKKYQRNVGAVIALNGLDTLPANAAADSVAWKVESFGATGAALQALDNTLVNVNAKGVILLSRTVRVTDANGNAAIATTYFEITIV